MIYFISDIHLGFYEREKDRLRENLLLDFLRKIEDNCETLFIAGDLFDFWFDYKTVIPKYFYRTLTALYYFRQKGINIEYLIGNHDFGHKDFFREELSITPIEGDIERTLHGKRFYISHGDGKAINDGPYLVLKKIMRNPTSQRIYRRLHPDKGIRLASTSSKKSRNYTGTKNYGEVEGMEEFAKSKIDEGFDYVIMGHRHKAMVKQFGKGAYINLGEWMTKPHYAVFDGSGVELVEISL